jgi:hypothetical protein
MKFFMFIPNDDSQTQDAALAKAATQTAAP